MARRRYVRDNRGRFASTGATARGGRLKTASGKKRETQTMKASGGGVAGTIGKPKQTKLKPQQVRDLQSKSRQLKASASRNSARMGNTGNTPAQQAKFAKAAQADRKAAAAIDKNLKGQAAPPNVMAKSARLDGEGIGGRYKGKGKTSLYGKDLSKTKAARPSGTIGKPKGLKPGTIKPKPQASSARQAATDRLKIKTATRRKLKADRASVIPEQSAGSKTMKAGRVRSTVSKPRTKGNAPAQIASRVRRKNAANQAGLKQMGRYGNVPKPSTYDRAIKRANTLKRADAYLKTGKLPGKDNSIRAQRELKAAKQRLSAKNAARRADRAESNIPMRGRRARSLDASINRAVKEVKAAKMAQLMKPKAQVKAERAARAEAKRAAALAKPKRVRSAESLRMSRAKRVLKEREMKTSGTLKQWEQSKRTQERALAFYKSNKRKGTAATRQKTSDAEKTIKAAQRRLKTKQYGYTASQSQALAIDRRLSKMTPMQLAQSRVRGARADVQRTRRSLRAGINENAPASWKSRMARSLQERKRDFEKAAKDYRILKPKRRRR